MKTLAFAIVLLVFGNICSAQNETTNLEVTINNVKNDNGVVLLALHSEDTFMKLKPLKIEDVPQFYTASIIKGKFLLNSDRHKLILIESLQYLVKENRVIIYGYVILKAGFFLSTSLFLFLSYYFLGERRWIWMFILSFPFVALFMFLLHGVLDIYLRDPLLKMLGIIG